MKTLEHISEAYGITVEQGRQLRNGMANTWNNIAGDWIDCCGGMSEALDLYGSESAMIAEETIDADRIKEHNPNLDLSWFYSLKGVSLISLGEDVWRCGHPY